MEIKIKSFSELTVLEYHHIMMVRVAVFVVEQECPYQEVDETDLSATHFWLEEEGKLLAYARIYQTEGQLHIGRVLVAPQARHQKLGSHLIRQVVDWIEENYPNRPIEISAQAHLQAFYGQVGFQPISAVYLEDNIPHIDMKKESSGPSV